MKKALLVGMLDILAAYGGGGKVSSPAMPVTVCYRCNINLCED